MLFRSGDVDDSDKYLKKRRDAISKAVKNEMTFKGLRILPSGAIGDVVYFKDKKEMRKAFKAKKAKPLPS